LRRILCPSFIASRARLQNISKLLERFEPGLSPVQQSDRVFRCRRIQVHVPQRRRQVRVRGQFLEGPRRRAVHRQVRTERVPKDVHALLDSRDAGRDELVTGRLVIVIAEKYSILLIPRL
jgi:hypothetical protein